MAKPIMTQIPAEPRPLVVEASEAITARLEEMLAYAPCLEDSDRVTELHQMRIAAKQLRYTMEIFEEVYLTGADRGKAYSGIINEVKLLQEYLGDLHDADVLVPLLTEHLTRLLGSGFGKTKKGEPILGVHRVDFEACQGLLTLCRETRDKREATYERLVRAWKRLLEERVFENLRMLLTSVSIEAQPEIAQNGNAKPAARPAALPVGKKEDADGEVRPDANTVVRPAPRRPRRTAANAGGHPRPGADSGKGTPESRLE